MNKIYEIEAVNSKKMTGREKGLRQKGVATPENVGEYTGELANYEILNPIEYFDEEGKSLGFTEVGSIQEVPVALGDTWVASGDAKKVEVEKKEEKKEQVAKANKK